MKNQIKTWKTAWNKRNTYIYEKSEGSNCILYPGLIDIATGYEVTVEDIRLLHSLDDAEAYNNDKNITPPVQEWQKPGIDAWMEAHPGEPVPKVSVLSLDELLENEDGTDCDQDKGGAIGRASMSLYQAEERGNPMVDKMREIVMEMGEEYWRIYVRYTIEGRTFEEIGREMGVSDRAISKRFNKIQNIIKVKMM